MANDGDGYNVIGSEFSGFPAVTLFPVEQLPFPLNPHAPAHQQYSQAMHNQISPITNPTGFLQGGLSNFTQHASQSQQIYIEYTPDDASTGIASVASLLESALITNSRASCDSRGRRKAKPKSRSKPYKPPTADEFGNLAAIYKLAKLVYAADRMLGNTLPGFKEKRPLTEKALQWAASEMNGDPNIRIIDRGSNYLSLSFGRRHNLFKLEVEDLMSECYHLGAVGPDGKPILSPQGMVDLVEILTGVQLQLIWSSRDEKGNPVPLLHPVIRGALRHLFFTSKGMLGIRYQHWFGDRYPRCAFAYSLAMMEFIVGFYKTGVQDRVSATRENLIKLFDNWLIIVEALEQHDYYGPRFIEMNCTWFSEDCEEFGQPLTDHTRKPRLSGPVNSKAWERDQIAILWYLDDEGNTPQDLEAAVAVFTP